MMNSSLTLFLFVIAISLFTSSTISFAENIDFPRKQMANGIAAEDVICKSGLTLMIRISGDAACVKSTSAEKLVIAGFGTIEKEASMMKEPEIDKEIPDSSIDVSTDQMEDYVDSRNIIFGEPIHKDFPTIQTMTIVYANQIDPSTYILEYEVTAGNRDLSVVRISVQSDIETIYSEIPTLQANTKGIQNVIINANDPSSITAHIQSYN